ncbi:hypothetical protein, partial [Streptomyces cucumeris]|uniref:hypothetical protein n=1 Tax=Streptomyces cucumeris TaxID=2962890 RepID=UPI003D743F64
MTNETQRHIRLRLARQRPAPTRVRARVRGDQQQPEAERAPDPVPGHPWWKRIPWVHIGTLIGALAAIGSLIFTGIATYFGARVSQDQLEQSREDSERDARSQAMRVSYWFEGDYTDAPVLHVMNRSPDPVNAVVVMYELDIYPADESEPETKANVHLIIGSLAPCST